jgi:shikimate kinase
MRRVLLTGMSGTGKSTVIEALAARGFPAIDADQGWSQTGPDGDWVWIEDRIQRLLSERRSDDLFLSGCASNQGKFYPQFSHIILLSAPLDLIMRRLAERTTNAFGKRPEERRRVLSDLAAVEPLLRKTAGYEIDTSVPVEEVVENVLQFAGLAGPGTASASCTAALCP